MTRKQPENAEDLYARYFPLARATAARFLQGTGSDEDAEEVADDVMLELLAHPENTTAGGAGFPPMCACWPAAGRSTGAGL